MKAIEIIVEHSDYPEDTRLSDNQLRELHLVAQAAEQIAGTRGIKLVFSKHFFDQLKLKRGATVITKEAMMGILGKIINRGVKFFNNKDVNTSYVFEDPVTLMFMPVIKTGDSSFKVLTVVRDSKWKGEGQVVKL